jgi:hypothetical protein
MKRKILKWIKLILIAIAILITLFFLLSIRPIPDRVDYGASFSVFHSRELDLDWKAVYNALLNDLGIRRFRFSAHWPLTEPQNDRYNWTELDYQMNEAAKRDAKVVLAVGRRLPGWPECHEPDWAKNLSTEDKQAEILEYITATVNRYKNSPALEYWQVENEPFLKIFAKEHCGDFLTKEFLYKEIELVKALDPNHKVLVTDSGELSLWKDAHQAGDLFGTSLYIYIWNHYSGAIRYPIGPTFFRAKRNLVNLIYGQKDMLLIELALEPWLLQPIKDTSIDVAIERMNIDKFNGTIKFAKKAGFEKQYLWGAEWWYYMKEKNHPEFWERAREIFSENN